MPSNSDYDAMCGIRSEGVQREIVEECEQKCQICGKPEKGNRHLSIDHDHDTGELRGFLCRRCNTMLGMSGESAEVLEAGTKYLTKGKVDV